MAYFPGRDVGGDLDAEGGDGVGRDGAFEVAGVRSLPADRAHQNAGQALGAGGKLSPVARRQRDREVFVVLRDVEIPDLYEHPVDVFVEGDVRPQIHGIVGRWAGAAVGVGAACDTQQRLDCGDDSERGVFHANHIAILPANEGATWGCEGFQDSEHGNGGHLSIL